MKFFMQGISKGKFKRTGNFYHESKSIKGSAPSHLANLCWIFVFGDVLWIPYAE